MIVEIVALIVIVSSFFLGRYISSLVPDELEEGGQIMAFFRDLSFVSATALLGVAGLILLLFVIAFRKQYVKTYPFIGLVVVVASSTTLVPFGQVMIISLLTLCFYLQGALSIEIFTKKKQQVK